MTLHYTLVFVVLMLEMGAFVIMLLPLPLSWQRALVHFITTSSFMGRAQSLLRVLFVFIFILFLDSIHRALKVEDREVLLAGGHRMNVDYQMKVFRAQRNMYLTGFTLFLSLVLGRFLAMLIRLISLEEKVQTLEHASSPKKIKMWKAETILFVLLHGFSFLGSLLTYYFLTAFTSVDSLSSSLKLNSPVSPPSPSSRFSLVLRSRPGKRIDSSSYGLVRLVALFTAIFNMVVLIPALLFEASSERRGSPLYCWFEGILLHLLSLGEHAALLLLSVHLWLLVVRKRRDAEQKFWWRYLLSLMLVPTLLTAVAVAVDLNLTSSQQVQPQQSPAVSLMQPTAGGCRLVGPGWFRLVTYSLWVGLCDSIGLGFALAVCFHLIRVQRRLKAVHLRRLATAETATNGRRKGGKGGKGKRRKTISNSILIRIIWFCFSYAAVLSASLYAHLRSDLGIHFHSVDRSTELRWSDVALAWIGITLFLSFGTGLATRSVLDDCWWNTGPPPLAPAPPSALAPTVAPMSNKGQAGLPFQHTPTTTTTTKEPEDDVAEPVWSPCEDTRPAWTSDDVTSPTQAAVASANIPEHHRSAIPSEIGLDYTVLDFADEESHHLSFRSSTFQPPAAHASLSEKASYSSFLSRNSNSTIPSAVLAERKPKPSRMSLKPLSRLRVSSSEQESRSSLPTPGSGRRRMASRTRMTFTAK